MRYAVAGAALLPFAAAGAMAFFERAFFWKLIVIAILNTLTSVWLTLGLEYVTPAESAMLYYTAPLWTAILAAIILREKATFLRVSGTIVGFAGIFAFFILGTSGAVILGFGAMFTLIGAVSWAVGTVLFRKVMLGTRPVDSSAAQFLIGAAIMISVSLLLEKERPVVLNSDYWVYLIYAGLISTALGFGVIWFNLLNRVEASSLSAFSFLTPMFAVFFSFLITGEVINPVQIGGALLVFAGIYLANKGSNVKRTNL